MCDTFSTRRTLMLPRPWIILLLANHIVQAYDLQMSPKLENDEQEFRKRHHVETLKNETQ
ncbi:hypothetical protein DAPPUDRAFT_261974 [Daphnia pulex]|uniref:Uncharacterized protein n=1 Tax=Daphnia pulex TaxID=6669 RepID=E9HM19_DAPPU|nr:hypothetical protein DAPPUDRAFT_261974 [Daphnia pulex]|eukprot:EFX67212.1 hypothetical protein DAPPUDRAFT_261974 [Daphnia pulex]